jgi:hypothetical protein
MPPREKRSRPGRPTDDEVEAAPEQKKKPWRIYLAWGAPVLVLVIASAVAGAWFGLQSIPPVRSAPEEAVEEAVPEPGEGSALLVPGLDLARERPLGRDTGIMPMAVGVTYPGRATTSYANLNLEPRRVEELNRPLIARPPASTAIESSARDVTAALATSGGLGGAEPLRIRKPEPRPPENPEPVTTPPSDWTPRDPETDALTAPTVSTMPSPAGYTGGARERPLDTPEPMIAEPNAPEPIAPRDREPIAAPNRTSIDLP